MHDFISVLIFTNVIISIERQEVRIFLKVSTIHFSAANLIKLYPLIILDPTRHYN
jgi:hypothetical protein